MCQHDNKINVPAIPDPSWPESAFQTGKNIADIIGSLFPIIGPMFSYYCGSHSEYLHDKRMWSAYLSTLEDRLKLFQEMFAESQKRIPTEIINSTEFKDAVRVSVTRYLGEGDEKKRLFIFNLTRSLLVQLEKVRTTSPFPIYFVFNDLFDQLSLPALDSLVQFRKQFKSKASRYDIVSFFGKLHGIHGKRAFMELLNHALLEEEGTNELPPSFTVNPVPPTDKAKEKPIGQRMYQMQPLGAIFINWLTTDFPERPDKQD